MNICELKIYDAKLEIIYLNKKEIYNFNTNLNINKYLEKLNITPSVLFVNIISVKEKFNLILELKKFLSEIKIFTSSNKDFRNYGSFKLKIKNLHRLKYKNIKFVFFNNIFDYITNKKEILNKLQNFYIENSKFDLKLLNKIKNPVFEDIIFKNCTIEGNFSKIKIKHLKIISSVFVDTKTLTLNKIKNLVLKKISNIKKIFLKKIENISILDNNLYHIFVKESNNLEIINNKIKELKIKIVNNLYILKNKFNSLSVEEANSTVLCRNNYKFKYIESKEIYVNTKDLKHLHESINIAKTQKIVCMLKEIKEVIELYPLLSHFNNIKIKLEFEKNYFDNKETLEDLFDKINKNEELLNEFITKFNKLASVYKNDNVLLYQMTLKFFIAKFLKLGINLPFVQNKILNNTLKI